MIHPINNLNQYRKNFNLYYKSDAAFLYRTGAFICHKAVSLITLPVNFGLCSLYLTAGLFKTCVIRVYNIVIFRLMVPHYESKQDSSWWFGLALDSFADFAWNCIEHVEDIGESIKYGHQASCWISKKIDLKLRVQNVPKNTLHCIKRMEVIVDRIINLFQCRS